MALDLITDLCGHIDDQPSKYPLFTTKYQTRSFLEKSLSSILLRAAELRVLFLLLCPRMLFLAMSGAEIKTSEMRCMEQ